jgi:glutathione S-transferase
MSKVTLFYFQGSPNCVVTHLAARRKGIAAREVELPMGVHRGVLRGLGFPRGTVPAARIEGRRVQGSTEIMRALDALTPQPPLFPSSEVEEAARWGEEVLQGIPRRIVSKLVRRAPAHARTWTPSGPVGRLPAPVTTRITTPLLRFQAWRLQSGGQSELEAALRELGPALDRVGTLLGRGTLSSESPTAADLQIAPQVRMMLNLDDLRPAVEARPAVAAYARAVVADFPGHAPAVLTEAERRLLA